MTTTVDIVLPVLNEECSLAANTKTLITYLGNNLSHYDWRIVIADNGSTDSTPDIGKQLAIDMENIEYIHLDLPGRGRALHWAWIASDADLLTYTDIDLSTNLSVLPRLLESLTSEGHDIAIASRLKSGAAVTGRPLHREFISRCYSLLIRKLFCTSIRDFQCGLKAITRKAAHQLLPLVEDKNWFFDSELLLLAEKNNYSIREIAAEWTDNPDSRVRVLRTILQDLNGLLRLRLGGLKKASAKLARYSTKNPER